jgi:DNA polymerase-3 subunit alpha
VNRRVVESLVRCGAFDFAGVPRAALFQALDLVLERGGQLQRDRAAGQGSLFGGATPEVEPTLPDAPEWPEAERLAGEKETLGFYLTGHPLREHADAVARFSDVSTSEIAESHRGRTLRLVGTLGGLATRKTRSGGLMAKAVLEDLAGTLDVVIFPSVFDRYAELLRLTDPVLVKGQVQVETERAEFQLEEVIPLAQVWSTAVRSLEVRVGAPLVSRERLGALRALLDLAPGPVPISLRIELDSGAEALLELTRHKVSVTADWVARVEELFGSRVVQCRC